MNLEEIREMLHREGIIPKSKPFIFQIKDNILISLITEICITIVLFTLIVGQILQLIDFMNQGLFLETVLVFGISCSNVAFTIGIMPMVDGNVDFLDYVEGISSLNKSLFYGVLFSCLYNFYAFYLVIALLFELGVSMLHIQCAGTMKKYLSTPR